MHPYKYIKSNSRGGGNQQTMMKLKMVLIRLDPNFHLWLDWQMCGGAGCALIRQKTEPAQEAKQKC